MATKGNRTTNSQATIATMHRLIITTFKANRIKALLERMLTL